MRQVTYCLMAPSPSPNFFVKVSDTGYCPLSLHHPLLIDIAATG
jgi:hypothetical protein